MENYEPNSNKYKKEENKHKELKPVTKGKKYKRPKANPLVSMIIGDDVDNTKSYILDEILIPYIKKTVSDVINAILFKGENKPHGSTGSRVSYQNYYKNNDSQISRRASKAPIYDDVFVETKAEAEDILETLDEILDVYGTVSINDLYDVADLTGISTGDNYGWDNLRNARILRAGNGWIIKMPRLKPLV